MINVEHARKILGKKAEHLTDRDVQELCDRVYALADVALEQALKELLPGLPHSSRDDRV